MRKQYLRKLKALFLMIFGILAISSIHATNYYVSSILGTAGSPGTFAQPF